MEPFPPLSQIGERAFQSAGTTDSKVELLGELVSKLSVIDNLAFTGFRGTVVITGSFPPLSRIGSQAFQSASNAASKVELLGELVPKLSAIKMIAFLDFKGTVIVKGSFPLLSQIGGRAFKQAVNADSKVELLGELLPKLSAIEYGVFYGFKGTLIVKGSFSVLSQIGANAFYNVDNADSKIELVDGLGKLTAIGPMAFYQFAGTVDINGGFPLLSTIGRLAFEGAGNTVSKVELVGLPNLTMIDEETFQSFKGTVIITGPFPMLSSIGDGVFRFGSSASTIVIACSSPSGLTVGAAAFQGFAGTHDTTGEQCSCDEKRCTSTTATAITTATTATSTTTTTTTATSTTAITTTSAIIASTKYTSASATTTTATTTSTFTSTTTTTTTNLCNGKADDAVCDQIDLSICSHTSSIFQAQVLKLCPVLCNTCELLTEPATLTNDCICAGITLDKGEGGSDCTSIHDTMPYCYVAAGICSDSVASRAVAGFHYSYLACQNHAQTNSPPTGKITAAPENAVTETLHKHPVSAGGVVGIVFGVIILCGMVYLIAVQRCASAGAGAGGAVGMAADGSTMPERCSKCKAKTQFCTCQVRRGTLDMAASKSTTASSFVNDMYDATLASTTAIADEGLGTKACTTNHLLLGTLLSMHNLTYNTFIF